MNPERTKSNLVKEQSGGGPYHFNIRPPKNICRREQTILFAIGYLKHLFIILILILNKCITL